MTTEGSVVLCHVEDVPDGAARLIAYPGDSDRPARMLVVLRSGEHVHAFENRCPHFGVPLATRQEFLRHVPHVSLSCSNHYARFRWTDGYCEFGDCEGEFLRPVALVRTGDEVRLAPSPVAEP